MFEIVIMAVIANFAVWRWTPYVFLWCVADPAAEHKSKHAVECRHAVHQHTTQSLRFRPAVLLVNSSKNRLWSKRMLLWVAFMWWWNVLSEMGRLQRWKNVFHNMRHILIGMNVVHARLWGPAILVFNLCNIELCLHVSFAILRL